MRFRTSLIAFFLIFLLSAAAQAAADCAGDTTAIAQALDQHVRSSKGLGAGIAIVDRSGIWYAGGTGFTDPTHQTAVDRDTVFPVASVSKTVIALAVHLLAWEKGIPLESMLTSQIPDLEIFGPDGADIRILDLLAHTTGAQEYIARDLPLTYRTPYVPVRDLLQLIPPYIPQITPAGLVPTYSNLNYVLLSLLLETWTGQPFDDVIRTRILVPAGMMSSTFRLAEVPAKKFARGFQALGDRHRPVWPHQGFYRAAAGLLSTPADLAALLHLLLNDGRRADGVQVIPTPVIQSMEQLVGSFAPTLRVGHGAGQVIREQAGWLLYGHNGMTDGAMASMFYNRARGFGLAVMYNAHPLGQAPSLAFGVRTILTHCFQERRENPPAHNGSDGQQPDSDMLKSVAGLYRLVNPRFRLLNFTSWLTEFLVIRHADRRLWQGSLLEQGSPLMRDADGHFRFGHENFGHLAIGSHQGRQALFITPNRLYMRTSLPELLILVLPLQGCLWIWMLSCAVWPIHIAVGLLPTPSGDLSRWTKLQHIMGGYLSPLLLLLLALMHLTLLDSERATTQNFSTVSILALSAACLPAAALTVLHFLRLSSGRERTLGRLWFLVVSLAVTALTGLMAWHGYYAVQLY